MPQICCSSAAAADGDAPRSREGEGEVRAAQLVNSSSSSGGNATGNVTGITNADDVDYYHRMAALSRLGLVWVLPIIIFMLVTCCCLWWCTSERTMTREEPDVYVAAHEAIKSDADGFVTVVGDGDILRAHEKNQHSKAAKAS